jgi:hypothetical protein
MSCLRVAAVVSLLGLACGSDQTALVLEAASELPAGTMDRVLFRVSGPGLDGGAQEAVAPLAGPEARRFPLTLVLVGAAAGAAGPFAVDIEGQRGGAAVAKAVPLDGPAEVAFVPGKVVRHHFVLRPIVVPEATPPPPQTTPAECGPGCVCAATCGKDQACRCADDEKCAIDCSGPGTTCAVDLGNARSADVSCSSAAQCVVHAGSVDRDVHLRCANADCDVDCRAGDGCQLECTDSARCLLRCGGEGCHLACKGGTARSCADGVAVCNRDCP